MNKAVVITFVTILILAILTFVIVIIVVSKKNKNKRTLDYMNYNYIYSMIENKNNYEIVIKNQPKCNRTPCDPNIIETIKINDKEACDILKSLFDEIFKDIIEKEKRVNDENLTEDQLESILDILEKYANFSQLKYEIIKDDGDYYDSTERGYSYIIQNETAIYTISLGEKPNSGYTIDISKVEINGNSAKIYIKEGTPDKGKIYSDVIVYPKIQVKFNKIPEYVYIINEKTGDIFPEVKIKKC